MKPLLSLLMTLVMAPAAFGATQEHLIFDAANERYCNEQQDWCINITSDGPIADSSTLRSSYLLWDLPDVPDPANLQVWPELIRITEDRALVGILEKRQSSFSGGGFEANDLLIFDVTLDSEMPSSNLAMQVPFDSRISLRACFTEADMEKRRNLCSDQYDFGSTLEVVQGSSVLPDLLIKTAATRMPAGASRFADSSSRPALTSADFRPQADETCSYERTFRWSEAKPGYEPTLPLPDCREFTEADPF